jgi:hypothetical protein
MNAAITSVYAVIASWTPWMVVSRSATICEIETFITLLSSTITNWAAARIAIGSQLVRILEWYGPAAAADPADRTVRSPRRGWRDGLSSGSEGTP